MYAAGVCALLAALPVLFPLRITNGALTVQSLVLPSSHQRLEHLTAVEVGTFKFGAGYGYSGKALVLHTADSSKIVAHSFYCGSRRLQGWVKEIETSEEFSGDILWTEAVQGRNGMKFFP
jgi:hypothetical protein